MVFGRNHDEVSQLALIRSFFISGFTNPVLAPSAPVHELLSAVGTRWIAVLTAWETLSSALLTGVGGRQPSPLCNHAWLFNSPSSPFLCFTHPCHVPVALVCSGGTPDPWSRPLHFKWGHTDLKWYSGLPIRKCSFNDFVVEKPFSVLVSYLLYSLAVSVMCSMLSYTDVYISLLVIILLIV